MSAQLLQSTSNAQLGACTYLLHVLLEEAERRQSGFIRKTLERVLKDHEGIPSDVPDRAFVDSVLSETLSILRRASAGALPEMPPAPRPEPTDFRNDEV